jgi:hypothetical protein
LQVSKFLRITPKKAVRALEKAVYLGDFDERAPKDNKFYANKRISNWLIWYNIN